MRKIKQLSILKDSKENSIFFRVGEGGVIRIEDNSLEFPDRTEWVFDVFGEGDKKLFKIVNDTVITYE